MFANCKIKLINDHLIIQDKQNILVDTGSPISFHPLGVLHIGENDIPVSKRIPGVTTTYLSEKVGLEINGLIGMDIINSFPVLISLKNGFFFLDDDAEYATHFHMFPLPPIAGGLIAVTLQVNHRKANMIVDTGAKISYIHPIFTSGMESCGSRDDFSPYVGNFKTETYMCEVNTLICSTNNRVYSQLFGTPPEIISMTLQQLNVDGIIGIDLFKRFRLQIRNSVLYLPPQGI